VFPNQTVGTSSAVETATLKNAGTSPLTLTAAFTISGDFTFDPNSGNCPNVGSSLAAGGSCSITVIFKPTATGTRTGAVRISDNGPNSPQTLTLTGTGVSSTTTGPAVSLSPSALTFPSQKVGTTSAVLSATLKNTGTSPLALTAAFTISGDFGFDPNSGNCPNVGSSLAAGGSCSITVIFTPTATGTRNGAVTIFDNAPNNPQTLPLTGTGS